MSNNCKCLVCGSPIDEEMSSYDGERCFFECPICGKYILPITSTIQRRNRTCHDFGAVFDGEKLASYLYHYRVEDRCAFVGTESALEQYKKQNPESIAFLVEPKAVENWYPKTFKERINFILLRLAKQSKFIGGSVKVEIEEFNPLFFLTNLPKSADWQREVKFILHFLSNNGILEYPIQSDKLGEYVAILVSNEFATFTLSAKAWEMVYELQRNQTNNKKAFIAMKFGAETNALRDKIKEGIVAAGYEPRIMDEIEHNHQIVPEMLYEIRNSRFVVAELSHHNNGAYYEAGFAYGQEKEVIHICSEEALKSDLHFDVSQINTVVYKDISEIPEKLKKRIEATII